MNRRRKVGDLRKETGSFRSSEVCVFTEDRRDGAVPAACMVMPLSRTATSGLHAKEATDADDRSIAS